MGKELRTRMTVAALAAATFVGFAAGPGAASVRYRVRPGDTLTEIAKAYGTTIGELARLNRFDPDGILFAGVLIRLPDSVQSSLVSYRVQPGDTLSGIAVRWGTSVSRIAQLNRIDPAGLLLAGKTLVLPRPAATAATGPADPLGVRVAVVRWADHYAVDRALALSVAWMESGYQPGLTSSDGAWGVMQVMPATWDYAETVLIGQPIPRTTDGGIRVGMAYLHHVLHVFCGDRRLTLAAYYQGEASARVNGVMPSSRFYVDGILSLAAQLS
jgi:N-acetylmuramoyl-L-alanine amidase